MDLYEYQGKELFARFGIPVSEGRVAHSPEEARAAAEELGGTVVVKAQVLTGGRGKAGGIKLADSPGEAETRAGEILGLDIRGHVVRNLWVERASEIAKEYYLSLTFDRGEKKPLFMLTTQGGVDIEEVAAETPEALARLHVDPLVGFQPYQARWLCFTAGVTDPGEQKQVVALVEKLYRAFVECDAMLCEVNPLIVTPDGDVRALDAKVTLDDNALFRHRDLAGYRDPDEETPAEREAHEVGINYIKLDGNIGCMVNGAGLAMATMDIIKLAGGEPANFLDVGGGANAEQIKNAFRILMSDTSVKAVLINIFGGILRCDILAAGVIAAVKELGVPVPIVIRMEGTNVELGKQMLKESGLNFTTADTMGEAAEAVVALGAPAA